MKSFFIIRWSGYIIKTVLSAYIRNNRSHKITEVLKVEMKYWRFDKKTRSILKQVACHFHESNSMHYKLKFVATCLQIHFWSSFMKYSLNELFLRWMI